MNTSHGTSFTFHSTKPLTHYYFSLCNHPFWTTVWISLMFNYDVTFMWNHTSRKKDWHHTNRALSYSFCCVRARDTECQLHHLCVRALIDKHWDTRHDVQSEASEVSCGSIAPKGLLCKHVHSKLPQGSKKGKTIKISGRDNLCLGHYMHLGWNGSCFWSSHWPFVSTGKSSLWGTLAPIEPK